MGVLEETMNSVEHRVCKALDGLIDDTNPSIVVWLSQEDFLALGVELRQNPQYVIDHSSIGLTVSHNDVPHAVGWCYGLSQGRIALLV